MTSKPALDYLFSFGVVADIQYADIDNKNSYSGQMRFYRDSLKQLKRSIEYWKVRHDCPISFALQLGDVVDFHNTFTKAGYGALKTVLSVCETLPVPMYHVIGNHEIYNFKKDELRGLIPMPDNADLDSSICCYSFVPHPGFRFIAIDTYDISMLGYDQEHPKYEMAKTLVHQKNPNDNKNSWDNMPETEQMFTKFNGGLSEEQLDWLDRLLETSAKRGEKVVVFAHVPVLSMSSYPFNICYNSEEILATLHKHGNVVCYFAGHNHDDGYAVDKGGIHHVTFPGIIETPPEEQAFATIEVHADFMKIVGNGRVPNRTLTFR